VELPVTAPALTFSDVFHAMADNVERLVKGKREAVELALTCLLSEGHLLIEDVPGTAKTTLARCLAATLQASWHRIQFTPDLLPSDITGVTFYRQSTEEFEFRPGPVFANIVLGDEINRASPKAQSALLEVMEERRVTVDGNAYEVPRPFMVIATQNPIGMGGTYPLPEAQLDRFAVRLAMGYPDREAEAQILASGASEPPESLPSVAPLDTVAAMVTEAQQVYTAPALHDYIVELVAATRSAPGVRLGASPRGSIALLRAARVRAASFARRYAIPDDIKALAGPVLAHRLVLTPEAELGEVRGSEIIDDIVRAVAAPRAAQ
jgi:MoxR-like ATPase